VLRTNHAQARRISVGFRHERADAEEDIEMAESIVVGTDGSDSAKQAVREAVRLAKALGAQLHVVSAFEPLRGARIAGAPEGAAKVWAPLPDAAVESTLQQAAAAVRASDVSVETHAVQKDPADALLEVADEVDANLIVVGSKGMHGARRFALGNVPNQVSHKARCNVLIVWTD
jgi:nucleotide-binding universal stress UspA family protein